MRILLYTTTKKDITYFEKVAALCKCPLLVMQDAPTVCAELLKESNNILVVEATTPHQYSAFEQCLTDRVGLFNEAVNPNSIFFLSEFDLYKSSFLIQSEIFGNFLPRTYTEADASLIASLFQHTNSTPTLDIQRFFATTAKVQKFQIMKSSQKLQIVDAVKNHLIELGFKTRAAAKIATAIDELLMNAIFDAPTDTNGQQTYISTPRNTEILLPKDKTVELQLAFDGTLLGFCVADRYGTLDRKKLLKHISKSYENEEYKVRTNVAGAGIGLANVYRNSGGLLFESDFGNYTGVTIFFKKTDSFKDFKDQFHFLGIHSQSST